MLICCSWNISDYCQCWKQLCWRICLLHYHFLKEMNTFLQQGCIKFIESNSKDIYNVTKIYISNKRCSFELSIHLWFLKNKMYQFPQNSSTTVFNIDNNQKCFLSSKSAYYYDSEGSCDTEDWSNDAENSALIRAINYILTDIHI